VGKILHFLPPWKSVSAGHVLERGACLATLAGHADWVTAVAVVGPGRAVSASSDRTLRVWDLERGACLAALQGHTDEVRAVAPAGPGRAVSAAADGTLRLWDLERGACLAALQGHTGGVRAVAPAGPGRAVSAAADGTLRLWDLDRGLCLAVFPWDYDIVSVAVTPHPPYTAVAGDERGNVLFFRIENLDRP
jgi:WD40 repeat protein